MKRTDLKSKFITLIDVEESKIKKHPFVYAQIDTKNGEISNDDLREEILHMDLTNPKTDELYTAEELKELDPYSVLERHFKIEYTNNVVEYDIY